MTARRLTGILVAWLAVASLLAPGARAQPLTPEAALLRVCSAPTLSADWFAPEVLAVVPLTALQERFSGFAREFGRCQRVVPSGTQYTVVYEHGELLVTVLRLDAQGRFQGLLIGSLHTTFVNDEEAAGSFAPLAGQVSVLMVEGGRTRVALNADRPMAIGSAFKLSVLTALREQIEAGEHSWSETITLRPEWKSLPSGLLQRFPDNAVVSVRTLAQLMIAVSDNTATDVLIRLVGREAVEAKAPARNRPLVMTRELFILKDPQNVDLLARWRTGNEQARRKVLDEAQSRPLPDIASFSALLSRGPVATDVEWYYTTRELCALIEGVSDLTIMRINPGLAVRKDWAWVAFKGGSEPGVANLTTQLERKDGRTSCVSVSWNSPATLDDLMLFARYGGLLELLK